MELIGAGVYGRYKNFGRVCKSMKMQGNILAERVGFYPRQSSHQDSLALVGSLPHNSANKAFTRNRQNPAAGLIVFIGPETD
jgi:hypothetical protein